MLPLQLKTSKKIFPLSLFYAFLDVLCHPECSKKFLPKIFLGEARHDTMLQSISSFSFVWQPCLFYPPNSKPGRFFWCIVFPVLLSGHFTMPNVHTQHQTNMQRQMWFGLVLGHGRDGGNWNWFWLLELRGTLRPGEQTWWRMQRRRWCGATGRGRRCSRPASRRAPRSRSPTGTGTLQHPAIRCAYSHLRYFSRNQRENQDLVDLVFFGRKLAHTKSMAFVWEFAREKKNAVSCSCEKVWSPINTCVDFSRREKVFSQISGKCEYTYCNASWWILFKFCLLSVCDLTAEKLEFQLVWNFSLWEKSRLVWTGL